MKKNITLFYILFFASILNSVSLFAQSNSEESSASTNSLFKLKMGYLSNSVYNGRADSLLVPYLNTSIKYINSNGFYASTGISYLISSYAQRVDAFNLNAGYFNEINEHFDWSVNASKSFYSANSVAVNSEILGNLSGNITYNNSFMDISAGTYFMLTTSKPDISFNLGGSHSFDLDEASRWSLEPSLDLNFGTRNYYGSYISSRQTKKVKGKVTGKTTSTTTTGTITTTILTEKSVVALDTKKKVLLDYEISVPLYYRGEKWGFYFIPTYAIPQSPITYETTIKTTTTTNNKSVVTTKTSSSLEGISNIFYGEIGLSYKF